MGNKKSSPVVTKEIIEKEVKQFINEGKTSYNYITELRKTKIKNFKVAKDILTDKSKMKESINSKGLLHCCFEIYSNLISNGVQHEMNSTLYNAMTVPITSETGQSNINAFEVELFINQSTLLTNWINKTFLTNNKRFSFDKWISLPDQQNLRFDNLEQNFSSIQKDEEQDYSEISDNKELYLNKDNAKNGKHKSLKNKKRNVNRENKNKEIPGKKRSSTSKVAVANKTAGNRKSSPAPHKINNKNIKSKLRNKSNTEFEKPDFDQKTVNSILNVMNTNQNHRLSSANAGNDYFNPFKTNDSENVTTTNNDKLGVEINDLKILNQDNNNEAPKDKHTDKLTNSVPPKSGSHDEISSAISQKQILINLPTFKYISKNDIKTNISHKKNSGEEINLSDKNIILNSNKESDLNVIPDNIKKESVNSNNIKNHKSKPRMDYKTHHKITENFEGENKFDTINTKKSRSKSRSVSAIKKGRSSISKRTKSKTNELINNTNKDKLNKDKSVHERDKTFADLIFKNVSPLNMINHNKDNHTNNDHILNSLNIEDLNHEEHENKYKITKNKNIHDKKAHKKENKIQNENKLKNKKVNRIRIDIRNLLEEFDEFKVDSSQSSQYNERSKSKELNMHSKFGFKSPTHSNKFLPEVNRNKKKFSSSLKRSNTIKSSLDIIKRIKSDDENNPFQSNDNNKNLNINININSNNQNNFNNYSHSYSMKHQIGARLNKLNNKKYSNYSVSKGNSLNLGHPENKINTKQGVDFRHYITNLELPQFYLDLSPLDQNDVHYSEILKQLKENNKFLFEVTNEEKNLNERIKSFNYIETNHDNQSKE